MSMTNPLPRYRADRIPMVLSALKIKSIEPSGCAASFLVPEEEGHAPIEVSAAYLWRHKVHAGGYYVLYPDGHESFCEAEVFERNTTPLETDPEIPIAERARFPPSREARYATTSFPIRTRQ